MKTKILIITLIAILAFLFLISCKKSSSLKISGSGASFPFPFYSKIFKEFSLENTNQILINYRSVGSGSGIKDIKGKIVDFAGSDAYLKDNQSKEITENKILHIPTCIGAVVIGYNLPIEGLNLDGNVLASIFMGKITKWNDPAIVALNKNIELPDKKIIPFRRADSSGTTFIFSDYLSKNSSEWEDEMGANKSLQWDKSILGQKGNEGVTASIKNIEYSIGYISLNYAIKNKIKTASVKNSDGVFVTPNIQSITDSAKTNLPDDLKVVLTMGKGYPISSFTWILFYKEQSYKNRTLTEAKSLYKLLKWTVTKAQKHAESLYYAPVSEEAKQKSLKLIETMTYKGKKIKNL